MKIAKNILTKSIVLGIFIVPFIAFIVPSGMYFPFIAGKGFIFRILSEILLGFYVLLAVLAPEYRPKLSWISKAVLVFTVAILAADLLGENVYKSIWSNYERMEGFVLIAHLTAYYIVISSIFKTKNEWNRFLNISIIGSVVMSLYGVFQLIGKIAISQGGVRVDGTFGNASYLAIYLVFHIFLCLYMLADKTRTNSQKWLYGLAIALETSILYFTATRGAILGLIGGVILSAILVAWKEKENVKLRKITYKILGAVLILILVFIGMRNTSLVKTSPVLSRFSTLSIAEFKTQGRYFIWPMAVKGIMERPIFGWGQENFNFVFNKYYNPAMFGQEEWFDRSHNMILDWLIAGGVIGFLAYAGLYVALFYYLWRKESPLSLPEKSIFTGMLFAFVFHNMFVFDNLISYIIFFSLLAYMHSLSAKRETLSGKFYNYKFSETVSMYVIAPVTLLLTIVILYSVNVPAILANYNLIYALRPQNEGPEKNLELFKQVYGYNSFGSTEATEQLIAVTSQFISSQAGPETKQKFYDFTAQKILEKINSSPHDARYLVMAGSFFNHFGNYDDAIKYLTRALEESPKKQSIYFELGSSYLGKGDREKAFELFKRSYDLNPDYIESKIIYAVGAIYTKNVQLLNQILPQIDKKILISDNRFLKAYADIGENNTVVLILSTRLSEDPTNPQTKLSLASAYSVTGQKQKAIDLINEVIASNPEFKTQGEAYIKQVQNQ